MLYLVHCLDKPNAGALRKETFDAHVAYLKSTPIEIVLAGPILAEDEAVIGSFLVVEADNKSEAEAFSAGDPYAKAGLFESVHVNAWKRVRG
ncbi:MAG TPA: YciI family protein [Alphaproteobacteria bacterium]|nr:YciI family protein [Alphaproteobacteria bacterium]